MIVAIYARVSTRDKGQETENQLFDLAAWCETNEYLYKTYKEEETATGKRRRPVFEQMLADADAHKFSILVVWSLDRFSREGPLKTMLILDRLTRAGVKVKSLKESWLDPESPTYDLLVPIFAWMAKQEAKRISERVHAGLATARAKGKILGRPKLSLDVNLVAQRRREGKPWRAIAQEFGVGTPTVMRAAQKANARHEKALSG